MRVLGIDPGPAESAFVLFEGETQEIVETGELVNGAMREKIETWPARPRTLLALEEVVSYGKPTSTDAFRTARWCGRFDASWGWRHVYYSRHKIKGHLVRAGGRGTDAQVRRALVDRFGKEILTRLGPGSHVLAAFAVAVVAHDRLADTLKLARRR